MSKTVQYELELILIASSAMPLKWRKIAWWKNSAEKKLAANENYH